MPRRGHRSEEVLKGNSCATPLRLQRLHAADDALQQLQAAEALRSGAVEASCAVSEQTALEIKRMRLQLEPPAADDLQTEPPEVRLALQHAPADLAAAFAVAIEQRRLLAAHLSDAQRSLDLAHQAVETCEALGVCSVADDMAAPWRAQQLLAGTDVVEPPAVQLLLALDGGVHREDRAAWPAPSRREAASGEARTQRAAERNRVLWEQLLAHWRNGMLA